MTKEELKQEAEEYTKNLLKKLGIKEDMLLENHPKYLRQESMNFVALDVENVTDAYLAGAEPREKRIAELEKKAKNAWDENVRLVVNLRNEIESLKKENAELKKQLEMSNKVYNDNLDYSHHIEGQLIKAKKIIKYLLDFIKQEGYRTRWDINIVQAEQFISEVEK